MLPRPFETPYAYIRRAGGVSYKQYYRTARDLKRRGAVEITVGKGQKFIKLTKKGELEALLNHARLERSQRWDGKWRLIIFDIPEQARSKRDQLRWLLKKDRFMKLQASVFISPFSLNRAAIEFLKKTKLINYIRLLRVDEVDDDQDLRKHFKLINTDKSRP